MKRAVFQKFIWILTLALILSGSIFSVTMSNILLDKTRDNMLGSLKVVEYSLDYEGDLQEQVLQWKKVQFDHNTRFTVMDLEGNILADSDVDTYGSMKNHSDREEVKEALISGIGEARRSSDTLNLQMMYMSILADGGNYILRMAVPYAGIFEYIGALFPAILISIGISLLVSILLANHFSSTITKPLKDIAEELHKLKEDNPEFEFKDYRYEEMNAIADTTKHMAEAARESRRRIEFEKLVRQEFFSNASHELKTPITSIRGYAELLENGMATDEQMKKEFLSRIKKETENMTTLINDILMISRLETKEAEVELTEVRLCPLVEEVCSSLEPLAKEYQVTISSNCKPLTIRANIGQLKEIFNNLIINAIKYNKPKGKVFVTVTAEVKEIVIIVEDTGVGIPEEAKQRVFERFYRVDRGRSKKVGGTGLGLSIVKHVVNYYNGTIELDSQVNVGTRFTIRLPMNRPSAMNASKL